MTHDNHSHRPVALVTGSARGIGRGVAERLGADGYAVIVNGVSPADLTDTTRGAGATVAAIRDSGGVAEFCRADISKADDRQALMTFVDERFERLDLLVNNAGVAPAERRDILEADEASFERLMRINVQGPYFLTQLAARRMIEHQRAGRVERARVCFITSISAYTSSTSRGEYCVSKAGLSMASALFADRLAEFSIPVIEIRPGVIATDMTAGVLEKYERLIEEGLLPEKRMGRPEDIARAVSAVARGDFDYSTGAAIDVSGGFNLRRL